MDRRYDSRREKREAKEKNKKSKGRMRGRGGGGGAGRGRGGARYKKGRGNAYQGHKEGGEATGLGGAPPLEWDERALVTDTDGVLLYMINGQVTLLFTSVVNCPSLAIELHYVSCELVRIYHHRSICTNVGQTEARVSRLF